MMEIIGKQLEEFKDINIGDKVLTHNKQYKKVIWKRKQKKKYLKIKLSNGKTIRITKDHLVLTDNGWIEIGKLSKGDSICGIVKD